MGLPVIATVARPLSPSSTKPRTVTPVRTGYMGNGCAEYIVTLPRGTTWLPPGEKPPVSPHDRPMPSHQRLGSHDQQRLCQFLIAQQEAGQRESEPLDGHQRGSLARLALQDRYFVVESQHQAGLFAAKDQPEHQVDGREQHQHNVPEDGRQDAAAKARSQPRGSREPMALASWMPRVSFGALRARMAVPL